VFSESALSSILNATTSEALSPKEAHDAIVVGAGAAGGLAAMLLTESGLNVLVLDASWPRSLRDNRLRRLPGNLVRRLGAPDRSRPLPIPAAYVPKTRDALRMLGLWRQPIQSRCYAWQFAPDVFVDDHDCPYVTPPDRPFVWIRARIIGGRLAVPGHGRQYYRLGPDDLHPKDRLSPIWPLRPNELDPWYSLVEGRLGLSGMTDQIPFLPDSELSQHLTFTKAETALRNKIVARWPGARPILSRYAPPLETLEAAARTGRLRCRQGAIVRGIHVNGSGHVCGVSWIDHRTQTKQRSAAPLVFLCASALESTRILMLSRSPRTPEGLGASSGVLGRYLMDHIMVGMEGAGRHRVLRTAPDDGRCFYLPRFDARTLAAPNPAPGYNLQLYQFPAGWGETYFVAFAFAEMLPRPENRVTIDPHRRDAWGIPVLHIDCGFSEAETHRAREQAHALRELAEVADVAITRIDEVPRPPGSAIHECGTARMGNDPGDSVLDPYNQCWDARGLYVTDAASFPSQGSQNPTLTILALTARACHHALRDMNVEPVFAKADHGFPLQV